MGDLIKKAGLIFFMWASIALMAQGRSLKDGFEASLGGGENHSLGGSYDFWLFGDGGVFKNASGFSINYIHWENEGVGYGLSWGLQAVEPSDEVMTENVRIGGVELGFDNALMFDGDATLMPASIFLVGRQMVGKRSAIGINVGARYVMADSSMRYSGTSTSVIGADRNTFDVSGDIKVDDSALIYALAEFQYYFTRKIRASAGLGYQFSILSGDIDRTQVNGSTKTDDGLNAFLGRLGIFIAL